MDVVRFFIRPAAAEQLPDQDDWEECGRTRAIFSVGLSRLALASLWRLFLAPGRWCAGLRQTWRLGRRSDAAYCGIQIAEQKYRSLGELGGIR